MAIDVMTIPSIVFDVQGIDFIMDGAVEFCAKKTRFDGKERVLGAVRGGDCSVCEYLHYGLAQQMAEYLGSVDDTVKAVYIYEAENASCFDDAVPNRPGLSPVISMIVWVNRKNAALSSIIDMLRSAVETELRVLACPKSNALCYTSDVQVVDDAEVEMRTGYGAMINSLYVAPIKIWSR